MEPGMTWGCPASNFLQSRSTFPVWRKKNLRSHGEPWVGLHKQAAAKHCVWFGSTALKTGSMATLTRTASRPKAEESGERRQYWTHPQAHRREKMQPAATKLP